MEHNYLTKFVELQATGLVTPGLALVDVYHDEWCGIHLGQRCNCNPDITIIQRDGETL